jgi:hypothetical protein
VGSMQPPCDQGGKAILASQVCANEPIESARA